MRLMTIFELAAKNASERQAIHHQASAAASDKGRDAEERRLASLTISNLMRVPNIKL